MKKSRICPHCHEEFNEIDGRVFSNHVRWCKENPDRERLSGRLFKKKISEAAYSSADRRFGKLKRFKVKCFTCGNDFYVEEREKSFPRKELYFCSIECGHKYTSSCTDPKKISEGVKRFIRNNQHRLPYNVKETITKTCPCCGETFQTLDKDKKCCSGSCSKQYRDLINFNLKMQNASELERERLRLIKYRQECQFKFGIRDYPDEFDFKLIEEHGWYSAKNRGNNMNGVSRDHMYSVKEGFLNNVDPKIISHPANCRLILQSENASKCDSSSITLEELLQRIDSWNKKYK